MLGYGGPTGCLQKCTCSLPGRRSGPSEFLHPGCPHMPAPHPAPQPCHAQLGTSWRHTKLYPRGYGPSSQPLPHVSGARDSSLSSSSSQFLRVGPEFPTLPATSSPSSLAGDPVLQHTGSTVCSSPMSPSFSQGSRSFCPAGPAMPTLLPQRRVLPIPFGTLLDFQHPALCKFLPPNTLGYVKTIQEATKLSSS